MKKNRADQTDANGKPRDQSDDIRETDRFINALETAGQSLEQLSAADRDVFQFGTAVRKTVEIDLPEQNKVIRDAVIARFDENADQSEPALSKEKNKKRESRSTSRIALAASLLLAIGLIVVALTINSRNNDLNLAEVLFPAGKPQSGSNQNLSRSDFMLPDPELLSPPASAGDSKEADVLTATPQVKGEIDKIISLYEEQTAQTSAPEVMLGVIPHIVDSSETSGPAGVTHSSSSTDKYFVQDGVEDQLTPAVQGNLPVPRQQDGPFPPTMHNGQLSSGGLMSRDPTSYGGGGGGGFFFGSSVIGGIDIDSAGSRPSSRMATKELKVIGDFAFDPRGDSAADATGMYGLHYRGFQPQNEQYDSIVENEFNRVAGANALSTFSIDVDTASYANLRRFLISGQRPPRNSIRIEELINYFHYDYPEPEGERPFAVDLEISSCPWNEQHHLVRIALQGKEVHRSERSASNLVFLLDVSGSMQDQNKLPLLKQGLTMMIQQLTENDSVSIVTYAGNAGVVLNPTNGSSKRQIEQAIEKLQSGGSTNGSAGIELAYELAQKQFINKGSNRVILATDGDLNVGVTDDDALIQLIKQKASEGVFLTVLGFGTGNLKDSKLEKLADNGNGLYAYIDNLREAHKVLIEQMSGSLQTIAKDVKIQVEFNPAEVSGYRLIGYENRVLAAQDFDNDRKDAGEIGAGHSVTALYEVVLTGDSPNVNTLQQPLKYQQPEPVQPAVVDSPAAENSQHDGELLTVALRYKQPDAQQSERIEFTLDEEPKSFSSASNEFRFAASVAAFGMILRDSQYRGNGTLQWVEETASRSIGDDIGGYRSEFLDLVRRAGGKR